MAVVARAIENRFSVSVSVVLPRVAVLTLKVRKRKENVRGCLLLK